MPGEAFYPPNPFLPPTNVYGASVVPGSRDASRLVFLCLTHMEGVHCGVLPGENNVLFLPLFT